MNVYLVRHADAGEPDPKQFPDDRLRPLSADGKKDMAAVASGMKRLEIAFDAIMASDYLRARQTAECICEVYRINAATIETLPELGAEVDAAQTAAALNKVKGRDRIMLVGHQPHLGRFVGYMIAGNPDIPLEIKKGGMCCLEMSRWTPGGATLVCAIPPNVLRELAR
jgi:phosphohistidine phosphatase